MKRLKSLSRNALVAVAGGGLLALLLLPIVVFAIDELRANGEVARNVTAAGVDLGGLGSDDALEALQAYETELGSTPVDFRVADSVFEVFPSDLGLDIDEESILDAAMEQRRESGFLSRFGDWFGSFGDQIDLAVPVTFDSDRLDDLFAGWEQEAINNPAYEGGLIISEGRVLPDYPRAGEGIDRPAAQAAALAAIQTLDHRPTTLITRNLEPLITQGDIDDAVERATRIIDSPIVLQANDPEFEVEISPEVLARALVTEVHAIESARIDLSFSQTPISRVLQPLRETIEQPPRNAEFLIDEEDNVTVAPSRPQTLLDIDAVVDRVFDVADRGGSTGTFPFAFGVDAEFTTEMAEAMGEITRVSSYTTEHPAGEPRVINIQTMAKAVDGAIVMPGEEFDLNGHVGERTEAKGYVPAPMILRGEVVDSVGGGVSQFATTIYNTMFFGCYQDITHKPHSFWFSRYPEGREATVSWGGPELVFKNDTESILIIKTAFTSRSITVKMFGNTGGRECTAGIGDRYRYVDPPVEYEADETLPPGTEVEESAGTRGWTIDVFRFVIYQDGTDETQAWSHRYVPRPKKIRAHPCDLEGAANPCLIKVPDVTGLKAGKAKSTIATWTFVAATETVTVEDEALDGKVVSQTPAAGKPHARGATVTIQIGEFVDDGGGGGGGNQGDQGDQFGLQ
ncbi:MAG: PASTA domain-containing protein [bacterium]|nr:PASTA domain-containing protein [bacterium]